MCVSPQAGAFGPTNGQSKPDAKPSSRKHDMEVASSSAESSDEEEDLKRNLKEQVHREVREGMKKDRDEKDDEAQKERNRMRKKIRKQHGKIEPSTKNKIRSIQRTLDRKGDKIPPEIQEKLRSRVDSLKKDYDTVKLVEKEREYALQYRRIKFFERKKLERKLSQYTKSLEDKSLSAKETKTLKKKRDAVLADLQYVLYFPRDMRYVSILNNPREVTEKLRSTEEFQAKMERARQIVLAYRASKLNQKQGSTSTQDSTKPTTKKQSRKRKEESQLESEDESGSESEELQKKSKQKKRSKMLEHESPAPRKKARKVGAAQESEVSESDDEEEEGSDEEEEASDLQVSSKADVSDEKAFMEMMREEQRKNIEHYEALNKNQVSGESDKEAEEEAAGAQDTAKGTRKKGKKAGKKRASLGKKGGSSASDESEEQSSELESEDVDDREDEESEEEGEGEEIEGLKGFMRDDKPQQEKRHRAENCLGPGDEEDTQAQPKASKAKGKGGVSKHSNSNIAQTPAAHPAQKHTQKEIGFMEMLPGSSQKAHYHAPPAVQANSGFMDMLPGSSHNRMVDDSEDMDVTERLSIMHENDVSLPPMEAASTLFKHDDEKDMQTFLDGLNAEVAAGQTKDDLLRSSEDEDNDGMPEKADLCRAGTEVGMEDLHGIERRRQQMLDQMRAIDKQAQEEEDAKQGV
jgi:hypothetical protein